MLINFLFAARPCARVDGSGEEDHVVVETDLTHWITLTSRVADSTRISLDVLSCLVLGLLVDMPIWLCGIS